MLLPPQDFNDTIQVRNCRLFGLPDLKTNKIWVRDQFANYLNKMVNWGVAGFRFDAARYVLPAEILASLNRVSSLNPTWFPLNYRAYVYLEVSVSSSVSSVTVAQLW
jgi:alpha-amylase